MTPYKDSDDDDDEDFEHIEHSRRRRKLVPSWARYVSTLQFQNLLIT
jgi:hypothetical protein